MATTYLDKVDVETELGVEFTDSTRPSSAQAEHVIEDIEAEVSGWLNIMGVSTPVSISTSPISFKIIRQWVLWGAASRCQDIYTGNTLDQNPKAAMYWERYIQCLNQYMDKPELLSDATLLTSEEDIDISFIDEDDDSYHEVTVELDDEY